MFYFSDVEQLTDFESFEVLLHRDQMVGRSSEN